MEKANLPWKDSWLRTEDGRIIVDTYYLGRSSHSKDFIDMMVYPKVGNYQFKYLLNQIKFLIDDVGLDGVYIDQFSLAFGRKGRYDYSKWDGYTVDIDPKTGRIERKYTDAGLVGAKARKRLCEYVLSKGKIVVANTMPVVKETQSLPVFRFMEAEWSFNPLELKEGKEPPLIGKICKGQLASPIALGYRPGRLGEKGKKNYARVIMKSAITYLRHGLLYYHYGTNVPESGPGSGECGPINHMFPITPIALHEGWIEGKERIITCISGTYSWSKREKPNVFLFDINGRERKPDFEINRKERGWQIKVNLRDWEEIAIIQ